MNAIDYVKQNGIEKAKIHLEKMKAERWINSFFNDLKQIVDAWELVEKSGGLKACRKTLKIMDDINADKNGLIYKPFSEAVNLVEQCL